MLESVLLAGNAMRSLEGPEQAWEIVEGAVGVFLVALRDGKPEGARRFLFEAGVGDRLYHFAPGAAGPEHQLVAVALEATTLHAVPAACAPTDAGLAAWLQRLGRETPLAVASPEQVPAVLRELQAHAAASWLEAASQEADSEAARLRERQALEARVFDGALEGLASLLTRRIAAAPDPDGGPLLAVAREVGAALGIAIQPPARSERAGRAGDPLEAIARASRIRTRRVVLAGQWWHQDAGPLVAYDQDDQRPVALLPRRRGYEIVDPAAGTREPLSAERAGRLAPFASMLYPALPASPISALALARFALAGRGRDVAALLALGVAGALLGMLPAHVTAVVIDQAVPDANRMLLWQLGAALAAAAGGATVFSLCQGLVSTRLETLADARTQAAIWDRVLSLGVPFFRRFAVGDLNARILAIQEIRRMLSGVTLRTLFSSSFALLNLGLMLAYSAPLAGVAVAVTALMMAFTVGTGFAKLRLDRRRQALDGLVDGLVVQLIHGIGKLRVAAAERRAFAHWSRLYRQREALTHRVEALQDAMSVVNATLPILASLAVFWAAAHWAGLAISGSGALSTGAFLAFNAAFGTFVAGATALSNTAMELLGIRVLWERARPVLEAPVEVPEGLGDPGVLEGRLELDRLTFRYQPEGKAILDDVTIRIAPGEHVALVGPSGSGKSTLVRLLLGFEKPESGAVYFDGQDLAKLDLRAVRRQLGVVLQGGMLTAGSIFENIACGALISQDDALEAARLAGLEADIQAMPMGIHTLVSEGGSNLSGGQRQRLLIARAFALKPRVMVFDEATSALDNTTQAVVSASMDRLRVTRLTIAHRLSTIRHADRIYVLDGGRVVQVGSFDELAQQDGLFARLVARQMV